jgi:N-acetylmuramoyl-L-alanine amidase
MPYKENLIIAISAGHGGKDGGAVDPEDKKHDDDIYKDEIYTEESEKNLKAAKMLKSLFELKTGHKVVMIRDKDEYVRLSERCNIANNAKADLFISIHANAADAESAEGFETLHYPTSTGGKKLAGLIQEEVINDLNPRDRGLKERDNLYVLKNTHMPAVLIEMGFITNIEEEKKLNNDDYLKLMMNDVVNAVIRYKS